MCRNKVDFCEDIKEQYKEMRDEFMAGLEDRKYLTIDQVRAKGLQVNLSAVLYSLLQYCTPFCNTVQPSAILYSLLQYCTAFCNTVQPSAVLYTLLQYCTAFCNTVQPSAVPYTLLQYRTPFCMLV